MTHIDALSVVGRSARRMRRWMVTDDLQDFESFPSGTVDGPFRCSVGSFVSMYAMIETPAPSHLRTWRIALRIDDRFENLVEFDVVEEDVGQSRRSVYCNHCRIVGWSWIPVCTKRYHFIIPSEGTAVSVCSRCGIPQHFSETRSSCGHEMTDVEIEDLANRRLEDTTHLLHGVVHANGYGHLLRVNGRRGGSRVLTGRDLMGFWDRVCKVLHVRKVSVMDASKKYGTEYRLLHGVTSGHSWYGEWGYQFDVGSFGLTAEAYQNSVENLSNIPLSLFSLQQCQNRLQNMIEFYISLIKAKRLFLTRPGQDIVHTWPAQVEHAEEVIKNLLLAVKGSKWVTWRSLKCATFRSIGAKGLLDYCLERLAGELVGEGSAIAARYNDHTSSMEYRVEPVASVGCTWRPQKRHLIGDLKFFYNTLLNPTTMQSYKPHSTWVSARSSAQKLLDCKQFIKHYDQCDVLITSDLAALRMWCHLDLLDHPKEYSASPPELLKLPVTATIADLKNEARKVFQETYLIFQRLQVQHLVNYEGISDAIQVKLLLGEIDFCLVRGRCYDSEHLFKRFQSEKGEENWTVDCACGAKDDDGERMLACVICHVWQHTRCTGINDFDDAPSKFVCRMCMKKAICQ